MTIDQNTYNTLLANTRQVHIKIDVLDFLTEKKVGELEGICISGAINISAESAYRRSASISFAVDKQDFPIGENKQVWIDKKIKIQIGLKDFLNDAILWFNQGHFIINNPSVMYSPTDKTLSFEALDYMSMLDGTFSGSLQYITEIKANTNISTAFKNIAQGIEGISKLNIESTTRTVPYKISKDATYTSYDLLKELAELYMDWEFFFDINGYLRFQTVKNKNSDPILWDFSAAKKLILTHSTLANFEQVRNSIQVWGRQLDNGTQVKYSVQNNNAKSPFCIKKIGLRKFTYSDDSLYTTEQARTRGDYELQQKSFLQERVSLSCVPIYSLSANEIIYFENQALGIEGKYLTNELSIPLTIDESMEIQAYKIYE